MRKASTRNSFAPSPRTGEGSNPNDVEAACRALFDAYDVDESGELDRQEFLRIELRLAFARGEAVREDPILAKLTLADRDNSGLLSFKEFFEAQMRNFQEDMVPREEMLKRLQDETRSCILERQKMGPKYHTGIRAQLRRIFQLYDTSGDASLSAEEWIAAQKIVAEELSDDMDDAWINEAAFKLADSNGDGVLSEAEYLEASFSMFEVTKMNMKSLEEMLENIVSALESKLTKESTEPLKIFMQKETAQFLPPSRAWEDEKKGSLDDHDAAGHWKEVGTIQFPVNLKTAAEVIGLSRLSVNIPQDTWLSLYYLAGNPEGGPNPPTLLRDANTQSALDYLSKANSPKRLYIKNVRKIPSKLTVQSMAFLEEREALIA